MTSPLQDPEFIALLREANLATRQDLLTIAATDEDNLLRLMHDLPDEVLCSDSITEQAIVSFALYGLGQILLARHEQLTAQQAAN